MRNLTALLPPQSGPVEQTRHQPVQTVAAFHGVEEAAHFFRRQHGRQPFGPFRSQGDQSRQFDAQHLLVQKQQGVKGLILRAGGDVAVDRQVGEKLFDFRRSHGIGVAQAVKADEAFRPVGITVFGAWRVLADATGAAESVEQAWRFGAGQFAHRQGENVVVEKGQGGVGFFQRVQGILFGLGDVFEEAADIAG